jgi:Zn-dependent oligopeptidase
MKKTISLLLVLSLVASQLFSMPFHEVNPSKILNPFQKKVLNNSEKEITKLETYSTPQSQISIKQSNLSKNQKTNSEISENEMNDLIDSALIKLDNAKSTTIEAKEDLIAAVSKVNENSDQIKILSEDSKIKESAINDLTKKNVKLEKSVSKKDGQITELNNELYATHFFTTIGSTYNLEDGFGVGLNLGYTFGRGGIISCGLSAPITTFTSPLKMADITSYTASASIGWIW